MNCIASFQESALASLKTRKGVNARKESGRPACRNTTRTMRRHLTGRDTALHIYYNVYSFFVCIELLVILFTDTIQFCGKVHVEFFI